MFLRATIRHKDGKPHRYWSVVETRRVAGGRVVQRPVLYLGEINDSEAQPGANRSRCWSTVRRGRARCRCFPRTAPKHWPLMPRSCACGCPARHAAPATAQPGARVDATSGAGGVCRAADDRRACADHGRACADAEPPYRTGERRQVVARAAEADTAASAAATHLSRTGNRVDVVKTFAGWSYKDQCVSQLGLPQSATLG